MVRSLACTLALVALALPEQAHAQRFGGQFGGGGGFWMMVLVPDIAESRSFDRDLGAVVGFGGRGFIQTGRVRLGGGGFGGSFTDEGLNPADNRVSGGLGVGGFTAEYLLMRRNIEVIVGALLGGGELTLEERVGFDGDVEILNRREESIVVGLPWLRVGYNAAPLVNLGLQVGYLVGSEDVEAFAVGIDVLVGLIP